MSVYIRILRSLSNQVLGEIKVVVYLSRDHHLEGKNKKRERESEKEGGRVRKTARVIG